MSKVRDISNLSNIIRTDASGNVSFVSGSTTLATINTSGQLSGSSPVLSSSYALNATSASYAVSASNATNAVTASFANAFTVANTLTAQTLVVQTITSSIDFVTGSTRFGSSLSTSTHQFTGSVSITGSLIVSGTMGTGDLLLSNQSIHPNEIDGTFGSWLIQEGQDDLFIINQSSGKKYKFNLIEI